MGPDDLSPADFTGARWLHISGVFPAVNESTRAAVYRAAELARAAGLAVALDPNVRLKLWDEATARHVLLELASGADYLFPGVEEGRILFGTDDPDAIAREAFKLGVRTVVVKLGADGAIGYTAGGERVHVPGFAVRVVDTVGAGDGWAAGFTVGSLRGLDLAGAIRLGNAVGALVCSVSGDVEGLPDWDELQAFLGTAPRPVDR
jgi:2-dehydro-3-deoxygluconokinase